MSITLASLIARLQTDVPAQGGVPTTDQYTQAVKDAVLDLGRRASFPRVIDFAVVAGQATYPLPADFVKLIRLSSVGAVMGNVFVTADGLVPFNGSSREVVSAFGSTLTISPTPTTSATRQLAYAAGYSLNGSDEYENLTDERASIALLGARAACLDRIAMSGGAEALKVTTALGETVDTSGRASGLRSTASALRDEYEAAIARLNTGIGGLDDSTLPDVFLGALR